MNINKPEVERLIYNGSILEENIQSLTLNKKVKFICSAVSSPQDCSKHFYTLLLWQTCSLDQTPSRHLWEASSHMLQLMREGCSYTYPPLSIARYSLIQLSELEQCRVKKLALGFNTAAQDSNPGSLSWESKALPLSHCLRLCLKLRFKHLARLSPKCTSQQGQWKEMQRPQLSLDLVTV